MARLYAPNDAHNYDQGAIQFINGVGVSNDSDVIAALVADGYVQRSGTALTVFDRMTEAELQARIDEIGLDRTGLDEKYELVALLEAYVPAVDTVRCATPVADPVAGEVADNSDIALSCATAGASIYYTINGDAPTSESTLYEGPITITDAMTLKAIAIKDDHIDSEVLSAAYTIAA